MSKKNITALIFISILSFCWSVSCVAVGYSESQKAMQYVMYVGTNDKDTYEPKYSNEEAKNIVDDVCLKYFDGYTLQEAVGAWRDEKGNKTHEYTLVCYFDDADAETVYKAADELIKILNQSSILIERKEIQMEYYSGN